jgi:hypothetical protein
MKKIARFCTIILAFLILTACGGLRFSQVAPEAKNFHPQRVAVLPADVGTYEEARGSVEQVFAGVLVDKKWFTDVVDAQSITTQMQASEDYSKAMFDYLLRLKTVNISDPVLSKKIGDQSKVDAFFIINVDYWNYTRENDKKIGKVGLGIKMIETSTGKVMWKAGHHQEESYILIKPDLPDVAKSLVKTMSEEMPH